jgi:ABC-type antimicrobial peptide transport system ATPase subunit
MYETIAIPENTEFYGYVEKVNLPVVGTNGSMKIKLVKMVTPNGHETPMRGYIYTRNNNLIGGEMSGPVKWIKMPHYQSKFKYVNLALRPSQERAMGVHTGIKTGSNEVIVLTAPLFLLHTLSD